MRAEAALTKAVKGPLDSPATAAAAAFAAAEEAARKRGAIDAGGYSWRAEVDANEFLGIPRNTYF